MFAIDYKDHGTPASDSMAAVTLEIDGRSVTVRNALVNMLMHCSWSLPAATVVVQEAG